MPFLPPTLVSYTDVAWTTTTSPKTLSLSWQPGDLIVAIFGCEAASVFTVTGAGLNLSALRVNAGGTSCAAALYVGVQTTSGTAVTVTGTSTGASLAWGFGVWVFRNVSVLGNSFLSAVPAPAAITFTPVALDSAVVWATFDFAASAVKTVVPTPDDARQAALVSTRYTFYVSDVVDQTAGATGYGLSAVSGSPLTQIGLEIVGTGVAQGSSGPWSTPIQQRI